MRTSLTVLIRLALLLFIVSCPAAMAVSLLHPPTPDWLRHGGERWDTVLQGSKFQKTEQVMIVDRTTGQFGNLDLPGSQRWDMVSIAPWCDAQGHGFAVARWNEHTPGEGEGYCGLARIRLPEGRVLDRLALNLITTGRPCWFPDRPDEILFPASDGKLYHYRWPRNGDEPTPDEPGQDDRANGPVPISWRCVTPGDGQVLLSDPTWLRLPGTRNMLLVSLSIQRRRGAKISFLPPRVWWLRLSRDGRSIEEAAPLALPGSKDGTYNESLERFPNLAVLRDGSLHLAYLTRRQGEKSLLLRTAEIEIAPRTGQPRPRPGGRSRILTDRCALGPLTIAANGEWILGTTRDTGTIVRFPLEPRAPVGGLEIAGR